MNTARRSLTGIPGSAIASLGLGLLGALSGCFNPTPPANVLCSSDGWCPSGQTCDQSRWLCVPDGQVPDAGGWPWYDSGPWWPPPDSGVPPSDAGLGEGIAAVLAAPLGEVSIYVKEVLVTDIMPAFEFFWYRGFFVQSDPYGPALFVALPPSFPGVRLAVGDRVSFRVYYTNEFSGNIAAELIDELVLHSRGNDVSYMVQEVTSAYEVGNALGQYGSELVSADLYVTGTFFDDGDGFVSATVTTSNDMLDAPTLIRLPTSLQEQVGLESSCYLRLEALALWRYYDLGVFSAYDFSDLRNVSCPAPRIHSIQPESDTIVHIELTRTIDPDTFETDGSQFSIPGLTVTAAALDGRVVTLTTTPQTPGQFYFIQVVGSIRDIFGIDVQASGSDGFFAVTPRAQVRINEIKANIVPSCDLVELRVTRGGTMEGVRVAEQGTAVHTFGNMLVATNDILVLHFNSLSTQCNRNRSTSETLFVNQLPRVLYDSNFDTAYDIYTPALGLEVAPHTIAVFDHNGSMLDIALVTGGSGTPDPGSENDAAHAAEVGEWQTENGTVPPGGFTGSAFRDAAATGLDVEQVSVVTGWSALDGRASLQRSSNADNNHKGDWTTAPHSFGLPNPGQSPF